jgi:hypothetical protein
MRGKNEYICVHIVSRPASRAETNFPSYDWSWWVHDLSFEVWTQNGMGLHPGGNILAFTQTMAISHNIPECTHAGSAFSPAQLIKSYTFITANLFIIYVSLQLVCTIYFHYQQYHCNLCITSIITTCVSLASSSFS